MNIIYQVSQHSFNFFFNLSNTMLTSAFNNVDHRRKGRGARGMQPPPPLEFFKLPFLGKTAGNIRAKPLDFRASNGENIRARDFSPLPSPPEQNSSRTPMCGINIISDTDSLLTQYILFLSSILTPPPELDSAYSLFLCFCS